MAISSKYAAREKELARLAYPINTVRNNEIQEMTIEGSNYVWTGIGYELSTEEFIFQEIPADYDFSFLKPVARYPGEEPEYLRAIE